MCVIVEESEESIFKFWEFFLTGETLIIFHIIVEEMDGLGFKEFSDFWVLVNNVAKVYFIDVWINGFVSYSGPKKHPGKYGESFEACCEIPELVEEEGDGG